MTRTLRPRDSTGKVIQPSRDSSSSSGQSSETTETATLASTTTSTSSSSRRSRERQNYDTYFRKSFYVPPEPKLKAPPPGSLTTVRQFTRPRINQVHAGLSPAIAHALTIPEVLGMIGQRMADRLLQNMMTTAETKADTTVAKTMRLTLAAMVRTCQAWYIVFTPYLYQHYLTKGFAENPATCAGLERVAHQIESLSVKTNSSKLTPLALARIYACCAVREYLSGRLEWPGLVENEHEQEEKQGGAEQQNEGEQVTCQESDTVASREQTEENASKEKQEVVVRTKSDLDRMTPEELVVYLEEHPLPNIKVARLQHLDLRGLSIDRRYFESKSIGICIRSFPLRTLITWQFSNCTWLPDEKTVLGWWPEHFPALESITLFNPQNESPLSLLKAIIYCPNLRSLAFTDDKQSKVNRNLLTDAQFKEVLNRAQIGPEWRHQRLRYLNLPFRYLLPKNSPRRRLSESPDGGARGGLKNGTSHSVGSGVYYFFLHAGGSLEDLTLRDIGNIDSSIDPTLDTAMTVDDWLFIAQNVPKLRKLSLVVPFGIRAGMWATILTAFRNECTYLEHLTFDGEQGLQRAPGSGPMENRSFYERSLIDIDVKALTGDRDDDKMDASTDQAVENKDPDEAKEESIQDGRGVDKVEDNIQVSLSTSSSSSVSPDTTAVAHKPPSIRPASVTGWCSVLRRLKLRGCLFIKAEGVLAAMENCDRLEALDLRETRVATMELFTMKTSQGSDLRWACSDSLIALGLDFGRVSLQDFTKGTYSSDRTQIEQHRLRLEAAQRRVDLWHHGPYPTKFSTLELLQIRRRLFTLHRLQILHLGGPSMGYKIISRLKDLQSSAFVGKSGDPAIEEELRGIEKRGGREVDSLLEHVPFLQVYVSLAHVANNKGKHWGSLSRWLLELKGGDQIDGSPDTEYSVPIFCILRRIQVAGSPPKLARVIGRGGFGEVHLAHWDGQPCAVKIFFVSQSEASQKDIRKEIKIMKQLRHPNIILFRKEVRARGRLAFIMEYAENGIVRGLAYIHTERIIHRDLKNANVLLVKHMEPKLCDFGLATMKNFSTTKVVDEGPKGSVRWMAPELFVANPNYNTKTDIYALGWIMWELATNITPPFREQRSDAVVINLIKEGERLPIPSDTPADYQQWIQRCWDKEPSKRPSTAEMIIQDPEPEERSEGEESKIGISSSSAPTAVAVEWKGKDKQKADSSPTESNTLPQDTSPLVVVDTADNTEFFHDTELQEIDDYLEIDENDDKDELYALGEKHLTNTGQVQDDFKAFAYFFRAAEKGHAVAQFRIGQMYQSGRSISKDIDRARHWFEKAMEHGYVQAKESLDVIIAQQQSVALLEGHQISSIPRTSQTTSTGHLPAQFTSRAMNLSAQMALTAPVVKRVIGHGASGNVYLSRWGTRQVAIKQFWAYPEYENEAQREFKIPEALRHRNIIQLDWPSKSRIAQEIVRGLAYIHEVGILHRDLKSANVLLTGQLEAKLADFNLSTHMIATGNKGLVEENAIGTYRWMAPELLVANPRYSTKSDVYALGMVMWEMAADCTKPYRSMSDQAALEAVRNGYREQLPDETPAEYRQWTEKCWEHDPLCRPEAVDMITYDEDYGDDLDGDLGFDEYSVSFISVINSEVEIDIVEHTTESPGGQPPVDVTPTSSSASHSHI
ncbi:copper transport protein ctr1 [Actinomortierella wolfii]|nr:copper transport protein ctr1 [Actinomortierella wolfii]